MIVKEHAVPAFRHGEQCIVAQLSEIVPLNCQGGGRPQIGDIVRVAEYPDAIEKCAHIPGGYLYWVIGINDSGQFGSQFIEADLAPIHRPCTPSAKVVHAHEICLKPLS